MTCLMAMKIGAESPAPPRELVKVTEYDDSAKLRYTRPTGLPERQWDHKMPLRWRRGPQQKQKRSSVLLRFCSQWPLHQ